MRRCGTVTGAPPIRLRPPHDDGGAGRSRSSPAPNAHSRIAQWLRPDEVQPAYEFVTLLEKCGRIDPRESEEWRRRITGWARFNAVGAEALPNA